MGNNDRRPKIRFKGFNDDWEQRKLIEYLAVSKVKNKDEAYNKDDVLSVSGDYGIVNQIEFQGRSFAGASVTNYGVVATGDVVYTKSPLKSNPYGIIKTNKGKTGIVSTLYAVYKPLENTYPEFVQIYFEQDARMNNYMHPLVNKGAKNDMKVSDENALKGDVIFPQKEEQIKISEYFLRLDNLISLHQFKSQDDRVHRFSMALGLDEKMLRNIMDLNLNESNINEFNRFDNLKNTVDKKQAKDFLEKREGNKLSPPKVNVKLNNVLREFILSGGFDI